MVQFKFNLDGQLNNYSFLVSDLYVCGRDYYFYLLMHAYIDYLLFNCQHTQQLNNTGIGQN